MCEMEASAERSVLEEGAIGRMEGFQASNATCADNDGEGFDQPKKISLSQF